LPTFRQGSTSCGAGTNPRLLTCSLVSQPLLGTCKHLILPFTKSLGLAYPPSAVSLLSTLLMDE
jgi:hypothetical protein